MTQIIRCDFTKKEITKEESESQRYVLHELIDLEFIKKDIHPELYAKIDALLINPNLMIVDPEEKPKKKPIKRNQKEIKKLTDFFIRKGKTKKTAITYAYNIVNGKKEDPRKKNAKKEAKTVKSVVKINKTEEELYKEKLDKDNKYMVDSRKKDEEEKKGVCTFCFHKLKEDETDLCKQCEVMLGEKQEK